MCETWSIKTFQNVSKNIFLTVRNLLEKTTTRFEDITKFRPGGEEDVDFHPPASFMDEGNY